MAVTNFTSLLGLALPTTGDLDGTWGSTVNTQITDLIDDAVAGTTVLTTDAEVILSTTNGANNQARQAVILLTGVRTGQHNVVAPAQSKTYVIINATTGGFSVQFQGSGPTTGVTVANGEECVVAWNGSDFVKVATSFSVFTFNTANGFSGVNSGGLATLNTTVTGVVKGDGSALSAAVPGTDYLAPGSANTFTALQTFAGSAANLASVFNSSLENVTVSATGASGTINFDVLTQPILYYTSSSSGNWTINLRGSSSVTLNSLMSVGQSVTVVFMATNGGTGYYQTSLTIDGSSVTPRWLGGTTPSSGNASSVDIYSLTIVKTGASAFSVFASQSRFA